MKTKYIFYVTTFWFFALLGCSETDNYSGPDASISGTVTDIITGQPLRTQQPEGFRIRMMELKYTSPVPYYFWGKADGIFQNTLVFSGEYNIDPYDGPFYAVAPDKVMVAGTVKIDFDVTPYLVISATAIASGTSINFTYTIVKGNPSDALAILKQIQLLVSNQKIVNNYIYTKRTSINVTDASQYIGIEKTGTVTGLTAGKYYVRVGAITTLSTRFNYSDTFEITIL